MTTPTPSSEIEKAEKDWNRRFYKEGGRLGVWTWKNPTPDELREYHLQTLTTFATAQSKSKDEAYRERNMLVCALSKLFPSYLARHSDEDTEWENDWRWIVYIDLPTGQVSWHIHDSERHMFNHLEVKENNWDGHTTQRKYERLFNLSFLTPHSDGDDSKCDCCGWDDHGYTHEPSCSLAPKPHSDGA